MPCSTADLHVELESRDIEIGYLRGRISEYQAQMASLQVRSRLHRAEGALPSRALHAP